MTCLEQLKHETKYRFSKNKFQGNNSDRCRKRGKRHPDRDIYASHKRGSPVISPEWPDELACKRRSLFSAHHPRPSMWRRVVRTFGSSCIQAPHEGPSATCRRTVPRYWRWAGRSQTAKPTIPDLARKVVKTCKLIQTI